MDINKINLNDLEYKNVLNLKTQEEYSKYIDISSIFKLKNVQIFHEKLAPNKKASSAHFHTKQNELFFILLGNPTIYINGEYKELKKDDIVFFEANKKIYHYLENNSSEEVEYLIIATNLDNDIVCYENK
ncbi:MAG: cupin domain-containing protein [Candidatus Sericytochromatia bacterium]